MQLRYAVVGIAAVSVTVLYYWLQPSAALLVPVTDVLFVLVSGACSILAFLVARRSGFRGKFGLVHFGLFVGILLWFLGETAWAVYEMILNFAVPFPSFADVLYLAGYLPIALGIAQFLGTYIVGLTRRRLLIPLATGLFFLGLTYAFLVQPLLGSQQGFLLEAFDVAYPVLDSVLIVLVLFMFSCLRGGKMATGWLWISLGLILSTLGDLSFSLGTLRGWYYSGHPIELIFVYGYVCLALGFDEQRGSLMVRD